MTQLFKLISPISIDLIEELLLFYEVWNGCNIGRCDMVYLSTSLSSAFKNKIYFHQFIISCILDNVVLFIIINGEWKFNSNIFD